MIGKTYLAVFAGDAESAPVSYEPPPVIATPVMKAKHQSLTPRLRIGGVSFWGVRLVVRVEPDGDRIGTAIGINHRKPRKAFLTRLPQGGAEGACIFQYLAIDHPA